MLETDTGKMFLNIARTYYAMSSITKQHSIHKRRLSKKLESLKTSFFNCDIFEASDRLLVCVYGSYSNEFSIDTQYNHLIRIEVDGINYGFSENYIAFDTGIRTFTYNGTRKEIHITTPKSDFTISQSKPTMPKTARYEWNDICSIAKKNYLKVLSYVLENMDTISGGD